MHVTELDLSPAALACLKAADIHLVDQLLEHGSGDLIQHPKFSKGLELYEIICELHRHGLTFSRHGRHIQTEREREMFRLRAVTGLTLEEIGERFNLSRGRIHQLLRLHFPTGRSTRRRESAQTAAARSPQAHAHRTSPAVFARVRRNQASLP
jgi:hypothetical protein